jgi:ribosomal protein L35
MKTNKSFKKRLKVTKSGKIIARRKGQNHYNAKDSGTTTIAKRRTTKIPMTQKSRSRFLINVTNK